MVKRRMNPASLRNLRPWRKGESGNPQGPALKRPFSDEIHLMSLGKAPEELIYKINANFKEPILPPNATWAQVLIARTFLQVMTKGDINGLRELIDRIEGKAPQRLDLLALERQEITIRVIQDEVQPRPGREARVIFPYLLSLVRTANQPVATAAAQLAAALKGKADVQPA